jgi:hypothetical protein
MLKAGYYVTVYDAGRHGFLLGPFRSKRIAERNVERGRQMADRHNDHAWFYAYGTARVKEDIPEARPAVFADHQCSACAEEGGQACSN